MLAAASKKPPSDGRSDETELEFPASRLCFVSRTSSARTVLPLMSRKLLVCTITWIHSATRGLDRHWYS